MDYYHASVLQKKTQKIKPGRLALSALTTRPGVYLYYDETGAVIYVGKSKNLKNRIRQYFSHADAVGEKTKRLVSQIDSLQTIPTDSEFDALLLEAKLIRTYLPKYNAIAKDDKSPLYIAITFDQVLPNILFTRKTTIDSWDTISQRRFIAGPFQSSRIARRLLQSVRRISPYCTQKRRDGSPCFYTHIGLCNPCPSLIQNMPDGIEKKKLVQRYRTNLRRIALVLSGQTGKVRRELEESMRGYADHLNYEKAGEIKQQLDVLDMLLTHVYYPNLYTDRTSEPNRVYQERLAQLSEMLTRAGLSVRVLHRIECIDISTIQGDWSTGSLVVFTEGLPDTQEYRRFRIKSDGRPNDVGMMAQVITRRFAHLEWPFPDLLIVDGGKPQVVAAVKALAIIPNGAEGSLSTRIPIIGLAKRYEEIVIPDHHTFTVIRLAPASQALQLIQHIRDEAHRFAKRYHITLRGKHAHPAFLQ